MSKIVVVGMIGMVVSCGCASSLSHMKARHAIVDDVIGKVPYVSDYCVVAVDGGPVRRAESRTLTVIPMVVLEPGEHTLTVGESTVTATFAAGKAYRIKNEHGVLSVVEKAD